MCIFGQSPQQVEGFSEIVFDHKANRNTASLDYRGKSPGYMTAGWWASGQTADNKLSWKTAIVPEKAATIFSFVGASSIVPTEFTRKPKVKISVNGKHALTFELGRLRDFSWQEGGYRLKYISKRTEFYSVGSHRQLDLKGNSGLYQLSVPAEVLNANEAALIEVKLEPFEGWDGSWFMVKDYRDTKVDSLEELQAEVSTLREDVNRLSLQTHVLATRVYHEQLERHDFKHSVVYQNGYQHLHPADLIGLENGELLMMTREASEHYARDGDVVMLRSKDGGLTWEGKQEIANQPKMDEREGCGLQLSDGSILVGIYYNNLYAEDGSYIFGAEKHLTEPDGNHLGVYTIVSKDNGKTWSPPRFVNTNGMPYRNVEGPTDAPVEMPDGSVVMAVIGYNFDGDVKNRSSVLMRSQDQGETWEHVSVIASDPGGKLGGFLEPGMVRMKSGRLIVAMRNHGRDHAIWTTHSDDDGKSWAPVGKSPLIGHPVDLIQIADGRLMATYGTRTPIHTTPGGVRACFSSDEGETWDINSEVQIRNDFLNWDAGYPESIQVADGQILTIYYYNLFGKYFIGATFWRP